MRIDDERVREVESGERPGTVLTRRQHDRDGRAGGITEAKAMVDPYTLQHAAQHQNQNTTDRYARDRSGSANKVIEMRAKR